MSSKHKYSFDHQSSIHEPGQDNEMDSRSFEISELGESKKDKQIGSKLMVADQKMKQSLQEIENWQQERIVNEQQKNQYYKNEIDNMKQELNQVQSPPSTKQMSNTQFQKQQLGSPSEDPFTSTERNQIHYQHQLQNMYDQQTNVNPRVFEYDLNKNNQDLHKDLAIKQYEQQQLNDLYQQANQKRQQALNSNYHNYNYDQHDKPNYRINKENDQLRQEINQLIKQNEQKYQINQQFEIPEEMRRYQEKQFNEQVKQKFENEYLGKILNNQRFVENNYGSDRVAKNTYKEEKLEQLVKSVKSKVNQNLRDPNKNQKLNRFDPQKLSQKQVSLINQEQGKKDILIRGPRDQLDLKIFGQRRVCKECTFLLCKGLSSQYCQDCGNYKEKKHPSNILPKRFSGVL
ncbi:hypothetical protein ABPG72_019031 [Tetrahymena utriculariae]